MDFRRKTKVYWVAWAVVALIGALAVAGPASAQTPTASIVGTVLDPQGMTIQRSLGSLGLDDITDVRQGKIFDVRLKNGSREQVERLAREVLTNPVIEEYRIIWEQVNP